MSPNSGSKTVILIAPETGRSKGEAITSSPSLSTADQAITIAGQFTGEGGGGDRDYPAYG
jgi:hypothetical protein